MNYHHIKVNYCMSDDGLTPSFRKIYLDDTEILGVVAADFRWRPDEIPTLKLEILATDVEVDDFFRAETQTKTMSELMQEPIEALGLSVRAYNAIKRGCWNRSDFSSRDENNTVGDVVKAYQNGRLEKYWNLGSKTYREITDKLKAHGLI